MYCPQCGTENLENASFCRGCGANISLVPQALHGNMPAETQEEEGEDDSYYGRRRRNRGRRGPPSIEKGIKNIFMGLAFVLVAIGALVFAPGAMGWWFWMLIPAFAMLGGGVSELVRFKTEKRTALPAAARKAAMPSVSSRPSALPPRNTVELIPQQPSVTENTTRHLETPIESKRKNL